MAFASFDTPPGTARSKQWRHHDNMFFFLFAFYFLHVRSSGREVGEVILFFKEEKEEEKDKEEEKEEEEVYLTVCVCVTLSISVWLPVSVCLSVYRPLSGIENDPHIYHKIWFLLQTGLIII